MSTRATIHFQHEGNTEAIVYRHGDGYPDGLGNDLTAFLDDLEANVQDNRFDDPSYLAAKWIVWDAEKFVEMRKKHGLGKGHRCDFLSIGIVMDDPEDIEYRYLVGCNGGRPKITVEKV